jgi:hypothetical protein
MRKELFAFFLCAVLSFELWGFEKPLATIKVETGEHTRIDMPVSVSLEGISGREFCLYEIKGGKRRPLVKQIEDGEPRRLWWIVSGTTKAGARRVYELVEGRSYIEKSPVIWVKEKDLFLEVETRGRKILRYNHGSVASPEGTSEFYRRSGFIHPLWSPGGEVLTWMHPEDHLHHLGLWAPWTKTKFEGREVDFWNLGAGQGTVRFVSFKSKSNGSVFGEFIAVQEHVDLSAPGGEKRVLDEELGVRVWNVGDKFWLVDYTTRQRCASSSPLYLLQYRYGGLGFRATSEWKEANSDYLTSEGKTRKDGHGTRGRWCNIFGTTEKGPSGILFMSHPENREHPEPMRIWPEGYVFFNFCPIQKADWTLEPGNEYVLRYRLCIYDGQISAEKAEVFWQSFANPPKITFEKYK